MTFRALRILLPLSFLPVLAAGGCTALKGDLGEYTATEATGSASGGLSSGETTTSGDVITGEVTTAETTGTEFPECQPTNSTMAVEAELSAPTLIDPVAHSSEFDVRCTVQSAEDGEIVMQCSDDLEGLHAVTLTLATPTPHTGMLGGQTDVRLSYRQAEAQEFGLDWRMHIAIHALDDDALLLFYGLGFDVFAAEFADFWAPLQIVDAELGACPAEWVEGICGTVERTALSVTAGDLQQTLFDGHVFGFAAESLWVYVERAIESEQTEFTNCFDGLYGRQAEVLTFKADP